MGFLERSGMARREASRWTHQSFEDVKVAVSAFLALKDT